MTAAIFVVAALSGGAALAYEVCWSRALVVPLGNSSDAAALVLAGFMLGMAIGARAIGAFGDRVASPLRLYGKLEIALGLFALVAARVLPSLSALPFALLRQALALFVIVVAALAMGASLPLLARALTRAGRPLSREISVAYGINTAGAACGALATGFFGIARLGVARCSVLAACASIAAGCIAWLLAASALFAGERAEATPTKERTPARVPLELRRVALVAAFVSGLAMIACELLWTRVLSFVFGHDAYAFAALLVVVLLGLSLGGFLQRAFAARDQRRVLAVALGLFGLAVLASYWGAASLVVRRGRDPFGLAASSDLAVSVWIEMLRALVYAPVLVLLPSVLAGLIFPAACSLHASEGENTGREVGAVFLANGLGAALGALLASTAMVQTLGIQGALIAIALASAITAGCLRVRSLGAALSIAATLTIALMIPRALPRRMLREAFGPRHQHLRHYEEGRTGTVSVIENDINGEKELLMNGLNEVTTRLVHDQSFKLLGHLGPLLHASPKRAVMICLGAGLSAGAALRHPIESLDVVDLSATVAHGARYFSRENNGALDDPRLHLVIADGRQFLLRSAGGYDLAVIDSTHPKAVDSWILYTEEFYRLVRARLAEGGVVVQWLPLHGLSEREFKIVVRTFLRAFPEMTLWANAGFETYGPVAYAKLVAVKGAAIDFERLGPKLAEPKIHADLAPYGMASAPEVLALYLASAGEIERWTEGLPLQTDDRPMVPYTTTFSSGRRMEPPLLLAVRSAAPSLRSPARDAAYEAQGLVLAGLLDRAAELHPESETVRLFAAQAKTTRGYYLSLAARYANDVERTFEAANQLGALGYGEDAEPIYRRALAMRPHDFRLRLNLALLLSQTSQSGLAQTGLAQTGGKEALKILSALRDEQPTSAVVLYNLGAALLATGDAAAARVQLELAVSWDPAHGRARLALAVAYLQLGELDRADRALQEILRENPWIAEAHDLLGLVEMRRGAHERASDHHRRAIALQPYRASSYFHLALALQDDRAAAERAYRAALHIEPHHAAALHRLGVLLAAQAKHEEAAELFLRALDADPHDAMSAYQLGSSRRAQGRPSEAKNAFCLALSLGMEGARTDCGK